MTTLTDSGVTTLTPFVEEDPIVQERLRPKHNSANTSIYHEYVHISYSSMYRPGQPNWEYTMWKFQDFSVTKMLREIDLVILKPQKLPF